MKKMVLETLHIEVWNIEVTPRNNYYGEFEFKYKVTVQSSGGVIEGFYGSDYESWSADDFQTHLEEGYAINLVLEDISSSI